MLTLLEVVSSPYELLRMLILVPCSIASSKLVRPVDEYTLLGLFTPELMAALGAWSKMISVILVPCPMVSLESTSSLS